MEVKLGEQVAGRNAVLRIGCPKKVPFEQRLEGVRVRATWIVRGKTFQEVGAASAKALWHESQGRVTNGEMRKERAWGPDQGVLRGEGSWQGFEL